MDDSGASQLFRRLEVNGRLGRLAGTAEQAWSTRFVPRRDIRLVTGG